MKNRTKRIGGLILATLGLLLLTLKAADYVLGWNRLGSPVALAASLLVLIGIGFYRRASNLP
jgi:hypothetical protein